MCVCCNTIRGRVTILHVNPTVEDTAVAIPPIPSGSSGQREQPGTNRSRIWTQKSAVIQACHGLDRWCLRRVITWTLIPTRRVSATKLALQPG